MDVQWRSWINSNILTKSDVIEGEELSVKNYFSYLFKSIILPQIKNKKLIFIYDDADNLIERALNVFFWVWIAFNKNKNHPYLIKSHSLNGIYKSQNRDILEYLESQILPVEFWENIKKIAALGYFSPELSDFGDVFWDIFPEFIMGHIHLECSSCLGFFFNNIHDKSELGIYSNIEIRNDTDPYVSDYINNQFI
jgi:hypothetical protein